MPIQFEKENGGDYSSFTSPGNWSLLITRTFCLSLNIFRNNTESSGYYLI